VLVEKTLNVNNCQNKETGCTLSPIYLSIQKVTRNTLYITDITSITILYTL
jgi:CRISPR/Cas system endoribonuclease Cas6 (RAMP superfamily)